MTVLLSVNGAQALSWQWSQIGGRERITIGLDAQGQRAQVERTNTQSLSLNLTPPSQTLENAGSRPTTDALIQDVSLQDGILHIQTSSPAFGFIIRPSSNNIVVLDVYPDALGARWQPTGGLAPVTVLAEMSSSLQPAAGIEAEDPVAAPEEPALPQEPTQEEAPLLSPAMVPPAPVEENIPPLLTAEVPATSPIPAMPPVQEAAPATLPPPSDENSPSELPSAEVQWPTDPTTPVIIPPTALPGFSGNSPVDVILAPSQSDDTASNPSIRLQINRGGPETWPVDRALSFSPTEAVSDIRALNQTPSSSPSRESEPATTTSPVTATPPPVTIAPESSFQEPAPLQTATATPVEEEELAPDALEFPDVQPIYMDEEGNILPPPPDIPALLAEMREKYGNSTPEEILPLLEELKGLQLRQSEREEVLYNYMRALYENSLPDFDGVADELITAANEAMNFNLYSPRTPEAMAILASVNLALNNLEEARGYANLLRQRYPENPNVAPTLLGLGKKLMDRRDYGEATWAFQTVLQEYPESRSARDSARLQTYSLYQQGHVDRALALLDFVERRWPEIYLDDWDYLAMAAGIRTQQNKIDDALRTYWLQYNLAPTVPGAASSLQRIAELYFREGDTETAGKILEELIAAFPGNDEVPRAMLRLGENGVHEDQMNLDALLALFNTPNPRVPSIYYQQILSEYPESPEAIAAEIRSAAWLLWSGEYYEAMNAARSFMIDYEDRAEALVAQDILLRGFARELGTALREENYDRILTLWERFPQVQSFYQPLEPNIRMALGRAHLNRGQEEEALNLMQAFLEDGGDPNYGLYAYNVFLRAYLNSQNWGGILALGETVANWNLEPETRTQLDYTLALSAENLGLHGRALPLWQKLAPMTNIPLYQRAYATYFLARDAERRQDLRTSYQYNLDTLGMFTQLYDEQSPYADPERMRETIAALMDVTEIAGRFAEALEWAMRYSVFIPADSPDYSGLRFREARLHRKMGDMARWRSILQSIVDREPDTVFGQMAASELYTQDVARDLGRFVSQ